MDSLRLMLMSGEYQRSHTIASIEAQIVRRLAEQSGRDPAELREELCLADDELPVERAHALSILSMLEQDFGVALLHDPAVRLRLDYARGLALLIRQRLIRTRS